MKDMDLKYIKHCVFLMIALFIIAIIFPLSYSGAYELINYMDSSIFERYASSDQFDVNIFFSDEIEAQTAIIEQIERSFPEFDEIERTQDLARIIYENKEKVEGIISKNVQYKQYLNSVGVGADELFEWCRKVTFIDDKIVVSCLYLNFLLIAFLWVGIFGYRKIFYAVSGIIYVAAVLSTFSDGISDYLFINVVSVFYEITSIFPGWALNTVSYENIEQYKLIFWQAFKESALTFIIFDTLVQEWKQVRIKKQENFYRFFLKSVEVQCIYLEQYRSETNTYRAILKVPYDGVCKYCNKRIRSLRNCKREELVAERNRYQRLTEIVEYICHSNEEKHTTRQYIEYLQEIEFLMYKCGLSAF